MPIFEYKCKDCGKLTEVLVNPGANPKPACEHCGSKKTEKRFSTFAPQAKESPAPAGGSCQGCNNFSCPHAGI